LTTCGIFLFMADDQIEAPAGKQSAPRDNVVYEAGFFAGAKGRRSTLVVVEKGAKVPTDLQGMIYLELENRSDIAPIETRLREYLAALLEG
jgi:predicted nucleotide-binding protein